MLQLLAGDIGGTKTILRLVQVDGADSRQTLHEQRFVSGDYTDLVPMVKDFLTAAPVTARPRAACLAIAGPVIDNCSQLTNLAWMLSGDRLAIKHLTINMKVGYAVDIFKKYFDSAVNFPNRCS